MSPASGRGGGAPGDGTSILKAMLRLRVENAAIAIADPQAVKTFAGASPGENRRLTIGGKSGVIGEGPVEVEATFVRASDGRFTLEDRNSHLAASQGVVYDMGPSVVVSVGGITILLTSRKTLPALVK